MAARNMLYVTEPVLLWDVARSGFTHVVLSQCHLEQNPALQVFRIINGPISNISPLFRATSFSQWMEPLNAGTFPPDLRAVSLLSFQMGGSALSDDVTVTVNTPGTSWTLTDNVSGNSFPMQVDPNGTFISFHGAPLATIDDESTYTPYVASLNAGEFPAALQQAASLPGPNSDYTVTQVAAQTNGNAQWLITDTTSDFTWFVAMGTQSTDNAMVVRNYQDFWSTNLTTFMLSLDPVISAGIPIFVSLGGWADSQTWQVMGQDTQQALVVVAELLGFLGPNAGVDYDWEQVGDSEQQQSDAVSAMTQFTQGLQAGLPSATCTICPYSLTISLLLQVWNNVGFDAIAWANCQAYSPNSPSEVAGTFMEPIASVFPDQFPSVADAAAAVTAGFTATGLTATAFADVVSQLVQGNPPSQPAYPNLGGVFTYAFDFNVPDVSGALQSWASAVATALQGTA